MILGILGIFAFFYYGFIGKVPFSAKCLFGRISGLKIFREKKFGCRIRKFSRLVPPPSFFQRIFISFWKKKEKKKKEAPRAPKKNMYFPFVIIFLKNNLAKFWKFWELLHFFNINTVSIGEVPFSAKCLFGRISGLKFF